jgi:hypothetical protein
MPLSILLRLASGSHHLDHHARLDRDVNQLLALDGRGAHGQGLDPPLAPRDQHRGGVQHDAVRRRVDLAFRDLEVQLGKPVGGPVALALPGAQLGLDLAERRFVHPRRPGQGALGLAQGAVQRRALLQHRVVRQHVHLGLGHLQVELLAL